MRKSKIKKLELKKKAIANLENQIKGGLDIPWIDIPTWNDSCFSACPELSICNDF